MLIAWSRFWPCFRTNLVSGPRTDWCRRNRDGKFDSECVNMDMYTHLRTALATEHFNTTGHTINDALVRGIMLCGENAQRKRLERRLIFQLGTSHPLDLNSDFRFLYATTKFIFIFLFHGVCKSFNGSKVLATPLMKGQS